MNPADIANRLKALDWSGVPVEHQLAASAAAETLQASPAPPSNVVTFEDYIQPDRSPQYRTAATRLVWRRILRLDGSLFASAAFTAGGDAWGWIVETVAHELGCNEDDVGALETDDGDMVTVDGLPVFRVVSGAG